MYADRIYLPEFTNREDLLLTVALFDDDTGDAIDLSGRTLAAPGNFTGNAWTVTDGAIVTNSVSPLTIPDYPIGGELLAVALTVGVNLGILPNHPVTIADPTGKNTMTGYVQSYVPATGTLVVQIGFSYQFEIRRTGRHHGFDDDYAPFSGFNFDDNGGAVISAALGSGLTLIDVGTLQILIPELSMRKLHHHTYRASLTLADGAPNTRQAFRARLPIVSGGVSI